VKNNSGLCFFCNNPAENLFLSNGRLSCSACRNPFYHEKDSLEALKIDREAVLNER